MCLFPANYFIILLVDKFISFIFVGCSIMCLNTYTVNIRVQAGDIKKIKTVNCVKQLITVWSMKPN